MNRSSRRGGLGAALAALKSSLQWRIVLLWILATLVPTLLVATPLWLALQAPAWWSPRCAPGAAWAGVNWSTAAWPSTGGCCA